MPSPVALSCKTFVVPMNWYPFDDEYVATSPSASTISALIILPKLSNVKDVVPVVVLFDDVIDDDDVTAGLPLVRGVVPLFCRCY